MLAQFECPRPEASVGRAGMMSIEEAWLRERAGSVRGPSGTTRHRLRRSRWQQQAQLSYQLVDRGRVDSLQERSAAAKAVLLPPSKAPHALISTSCSGGRRSPSGRCCGRPALQAVVAGLREDLVLNDHGRNCSGNPCAFLGCSVRFQEWEAIRAANRRQKVHEVHHLMRRRNRFTFIIVWLPCTCGRFCCKTQEKKQLWAKIAHMLDFLYVD